MPTIKTFGIIDERYDESGIADLPGYRSKAKEVLTEEQYAEKAEADKKMREVFSRLYEQFIDEIITEAMEGPDQEDFENAINYYPITIQENSQGKIYRRVSTDTDLYGLYGHELKVGGTRERMLEGIYVKDGLLERDMVTGMGVDVDVAMLRAKIYLHRKIHKMQSRFDLNNKLDGKPVLSDDERYELYLYTHHGKSWQNTFQDAVDSVKKAFDLLSGSGIYGKEDAFDYYDEITQTRLLSILSAITPIGEIIPRGGRGYFFIDPFDRNRLPELAMSQGLKKYMLGKKEWILKNVLSQGHEMAQGHTTGFGCPVRNTGHIEKMAQAMIALARRFHAAGRMDNVSDER